MKAFLQRLHLGREKEKEAQKEKLQLPPLRTWPPPAPPADKPLPEPSRVPDDEDDESAEDTTPTPTLSSPTPTPADDAARNDTHKKVAFISPPPTPTPALDRPLPQSPSPIPPRGSTSSAAASSSKSDLNTKPPRVASPYTHRQDAASAQSLRSGTPYSQMSANTSGSRILAAQSWSQVTEEDLVSNLGSRERTRQEVLFEIISSEERYVQELTKMKETFIDPLLHPYHSSAAPLSPLSSSTPNLDYDYYRSDSPSAESTDQLPPIAARFMSPTPSLGHPTPNNDADSLDTDEEEDSDMPKSSSRKPSAQVSKHNHPRSPYRANAAATRNTAGAKSVPFPSRSHHSLPPPARNLNASTHSLGRQSVTVERERNYSQGQQSINTGGTAARGVMRKLKKDSKDKDRPDGFGDGVAPQQLPEDLRICLEVIDSGVLDGHRRLSEALKKRYDDQYPLVRSLADVFVANSDLFHGYATYVLHLERALEQVDTALNNSPTKKSSKSFSASNPTWPKICAILRRLEESAAEKGETGLAITLSKPFQRLLKYPLLFQNLLFHTDPSTFEYESTLQMVAEVESIVRSIEDEKIQKEERDKTRDVFARIDGLDKVRQVALPKPSRVLLEEKQYVPPGSGGPPSQLGRSPLSGSASPPPAAIQNRPVRGKPSFKRLSDVLHTGGSKKDLWLVVFNDVALLCQRTGTTSLPIVAVTNSRTTSLPDLQGKSKYATTGAGRRGSHTKPRNLYKFIKIETWAIGDVAQPREGVVSMEDVVRSRAQISNKPRIVPMPADDDDDGNDGNDSSDSDRKSKMSFSYWGADKVTVQKPVIKARVRPGVPSRRGGAISTSPAYARESSANAKFGTRLVSGGESSNSPRPSSRRTVTTPVPTARRAVASEDGHNSNKATVTKPEWNTSTRAAPIPKRTRNTSQTNGSINTSTSQATKTPIPVAKSMSSPAPSEDSGVGLYRQMFANDPALNHV